MTGPNRRDSVSLESEGLNLDGVTQCQSQIRSVAFDTLAKELQMLTPEAIGRLASLIADGTREACRDVAHLYWRRGIDSMVRK